MGQDTRFWWDEEQKRKAAEERAALLRVAKAARELRPMLESKTGGRIGSALAELDAALAGLPSESTDHG